MNVTVGNLLLVAAKVAFPRGGGGGFSQGGGRWLFPRSQGLVKLDSYEGRGGDWINRLKILNMCCVTFAYNEI